MFKLKFTPRADAELASLENQAAEGGTVKQVKKALGYLESNPRHPSLQTHKFYGLPNPHDENEPVFEAYAQQNTPAVARILWCYGPEKQQITIIAIVAHP
jgi:hypothetical protein